MSNIKTFEIEIESLSPLIMHNSESADPQNEYAKQAKVYKAKRTNKTDDDYIKLQEIQFLSSLYWSVDLGGLYMPSDNLQKMLLEAARGIDSKKAKKSIAGVRVPNYLGFKFIVNNWNDLEALKNDHRLRYNKIVVVQKSRVPSTRAIFKEWKIKFQIEIDASIVSTTDVETWMDYAGDRIGLGCRRPYAPTPGAYGRFKVISFKEIAND